MKDFFFLLISITLFGVTIFSVLNYILLRKLKRSVNSNSSLQDKELFFELKSRIQIMVAVFSIMVAVFAFYGYNTEDKISTIVDSEVKNRFAYYDSTYQAMNKQGQDLANSYAELKIKYDNLLNTNTDAIQDLKNIELAIKKAEKGTYKIYDLAIENKDPYFKRFYYKDLKQKNNNPLPEFYKAPRLIVNCPNANLIVLKKTKEYFEVNISMGPMMEVGKEEEKFVLFDLIIEENN